MVWAANREQFYELLLLNCKVDLKDTGPKTFEGFFYDEAIYHLEETMPDACLEDLLDAQVSEGVGQGTVMR